MDNIKYAIEGILFAAGEPVKAAKLAVVLDTSIEEIHKAVDELKQEYNLDKRGFNIIDILEGYQICSRPEYYKYIQEILGEQRRQALSNAAMETLAIIAYKQPITRTGIEYIRGVNSDGSVNRLVERNLVEEVGRMDAPGRPILYGTTLNFLRCFGIATLEDLPEVDLSKIDNDPTHVETLDIAEVYTEAVDEKDEPETLNIDEVYTDAVNEKEESETLNIDEVFEDA